MHIPEELTLNAVAAKLPRFWDLSARKIELIDHEFDSTAGSPVFTVAGKYTARGWTDWTQGFQYGSSILQFDATEEKIFLERGRERIVACMAPHVSHFGVHDHGFNNISTYGNLLRLMNEGRIAENEWERHFYELALKLSGAVQARRWTVIPGGGFLYSFNGPHSLFVDTIRSVRSLAVAHALGHAFSGENDIRIQLLDRVKDHLIATARYSVYYGEGRDAYDLKGRTVHESIFNTNDGAFRCPSTHQGYSPFSTWTRGLAWAILGFAEELEFFQVLGDSSLNEIMIKAARATCDFYTHEASALDGIPYWDTGAPGLQHLSDWQNKPADPFNDHEPVDSSAAAIGCQGLLRLGKYLNEPSYVRAGLKILATLLDEPYLSVEDQHHGLLLHAIYHRPNNWDYIPPGKKIPHGEACMWGDYHLREAALYVQRLASNKTYLTFGGCVK